MIVSHSIYLANKLNDHVLKGVVYTPPTNVYIALFTSDAGLNTDVEGDQLEITHASYTRLTIDDATKSFITSVDKVSSNNENWEYPVATDLWGDITHAAVMDDLTSGHVLYWGQIAVPTNIDTNDLFRFVAGEFDSIYS